MGDYWVTIGRLLEDRKEQAGGRAGGQAGRQADRHAGRQAGWQVGGPRVDAHRRAASRQGLQIGRGPTRPHTNTDVSAYVYVNVCMQIGLATNESRQASAAALHGSGRAIGK